MIRIVWSCQSIFFSLIYLDGLLANRSFLGLIFKLGKFLLMVNRCWIKIMGFFK